MSTGCDARRERAENLLDSNPEYSGGDTREGIIDAVTDLLHLAVAEAIDLEETIATARMHVEAEEGQRP